MFRIRNLGPPVCKFVKCLTFTDIALGGGVTIFFAYFFYRSTWAIPFMFPFGIFSIGMRKRRQEEKNKYYHLEQFKECILSVEASLRAGYAVENAFVESIRDMKMMFGEHSKIVQELCFIQTGLRNNETLESLLFAMADKSGIPEIIEFAEVFSIAKRNSGNVSGVSDLYSVVISQKTETRQEIQTALAAKRLEQKVMNVMPFGMVIYLDITNPGYFEMLFHNLTGVLLMSACLGIYVAAYIWSEKIFSKAYE